MTFMESVQTCVKQKYAAFSGRASRSEYWWFFLFTVLGGIVLSLIDGVLGTTIGYNQIIAGKIVHQEIGIIDALFQLAAYFNADRGCFFRRYRTFGVICGLDSAACVFRAARR